MDTFNPVIDALTQRLKAARRAKDVFAQDPLLAERVADVLACTPLMPPKTAGQPAVKTGTTWARVCEHFATMGNQWIGLAELASAMGVRQPAVCQVFYVAHKHEVESMPDPARPSRRLWRLVKA